LPEAVPPATPIMKGDLKEQRLLLGEMLPMKLPFEIPDLSLMALLIEISVLSSTFKFAVHGNLILARETKFICQKT